MRSRRPHFSTTAAAIAATMAITMLTGGALTVTASPAFAHSQLIGTRPAADATVTTLVTTVVLTFNEKPEGQFSTIVVRGPDNASYADGPVRVVGTDAVQDVVPLRSGAYQVAWRVVSADGHPLTGEFRFTVRLPAQLEPSAAPTPSSSTIAVGPSHTTNSANRWQWVVLAAVALALLGLIIGVLVRRRHTRPRGAP